MKIEKIEKLKKLREILGDDFWLYATCHIDIERVLAMYPILDQAASSIRNTIIGRLTHSDLETSSKVHQVKEKHESYGV